MIKGPRATLGGFLALVLWSLSALFAVKLSRIPPMQLVGITCAIGSFIVVVYLTMTRKWAETKQPLRLWFIGIITVGVSRICFILAFKFAPATQVDLINYLWPLMVVLFSGFLPNEKFTVPHFISAILGFLAIYILFAEPNGTIYVQKSFIWGYVLSFIGAVFWALYSVFSRHQSKSPPLLIGIYSGITAVFCLCNHLAFEETVFPNAIEWCLLLIMGGGLAGFSYLMWDYGIKKGNFKLLSILSYLTPVFSVGFLVIFGHAEWTGSIIGSCALIITSTVACYVWSHVQVKQKESFSEAQSSN